MNASFSYKDLQKFVKGENCQDAKLLFGDGDSWKAVISKTKDWRETRTLLKILNKCSDLKKSFPLLMRRTIDLMLECGLANLISQQLTILCNLNSNAFDNHSKLLVDDLGIVSNVLLPLLLDEGRRRDIESSLKEISRRLGLISEDLPDKPNQEKGKRESHDISLQDNLLSSQIEMLERLQHRETTHSYLRKLRALMFEDFAIPMRKNLNKILNLSEEDSASVTDDDVYNYGNMRVVGWDFSYNKLNLILKLDAKWSAIDWTVSKRLLSGSLVVLFIAPARDKLALAEVDNRSLEETQKGLVRLRFSSLPPNWMLSCKECLVLESRAYYEAYKHVLANLDQMQAVPLSEYILNGKKKAGDSKLFHPKQEIDIKCLISVNIAKKSHHVELENLGTMDRTKLVVNESQRKALESMLKQEISLIQGPPGSGKSFVGLKCVSLLLDNLKVTKPKLPILVVCYTNHALDAILESIFQNISKNIVRVGGRSNSEILEALNLTNLKRGQKEDKTRNPIFYRREKELEFQLQDVRNKIQSCLEKDKLLEDILNPLLSEANRTVQEIEELRNFESLDILSKADVVGITSTGASKNFSLVSNLGVEIVIMEEAGQILESHCIASVPLTCQQLILIGDHMQLKPAITTHTLGRDFSFNISLFERLINNGMTFTRFEQQHRMRPEINEIIEKVFYSGLRNHQSVLAYPDVKGVKQNLYFFSHDFPENVLSEGRSKTNVFEAKFVLNLAKYLVQVGNEIQRITILTTYVGQFHLIKKEQSENYQCLSGIQVAVVDNFQGEENDVILLSLVRSGDLVGFLNEASRTCVAITRAKIGMYVVGNLSFLAEKATVWSDIKQKLKPNQSGNELNLVCPNHDESIFIISSLDSFQSLFNLTRCKEICGAQLICGHRCRFYCHLTDRSHKHEFACFLHCERTCPEGHRCTKKCSDICHPCLFVSKYTGSCGHVIDVACSSLRKESQCSVEIETLLECGHKVFRKCSDKGIVNCPESCQSLLSCGHSCGWPCGHEGNHNKKCLEKCSRLKKNCRSGNHFCDNVCYQTCDECEAIVFRAPICGHKEIEMKCKDDPDLIECHEKCGKILKCGHACQSFCYECRRDDVCKSCNKQESTRIFPCGHTVSNLSCSQLDSYVCLESCLKLLPSCGHLCSMKCGEVCGNCAVLVEPKSSKASKCGHSKSMVPCSKVDSEESEKCEKICSKWMKCGHLCEKKCDECLNGDLHRPCEGPCNQTLLCGHSCPLTCGLPCNPCQQKCFLKCSHLQCKARCDSENCSSPCKEKCSVSCEHVSCKKKCSTDSGHSICWEPCLKKLPSCGHFCQGYCGDPCPEICFICHPNIKTDDRFILLPCGDSIGEPDLKKELNKSEVGLAKCPKCFKTIPFSHRYNSILKERRKKMVDVVYKFFALKSGNTKVKKELETLSLQNSGNDPLLKLVRKRLADDKKDSLNFREVISLRVKIDLWNQMESTTVNPEKLQSMKNSILCTQEVGLQYLDDFLSLLKEHHGVTLKEGNLSNSKIYSFSENCWEYCDQCKDVYFSYFRNKCPCQL